MIRFSKEFIRKNEAWNFQIFKNFQGSSFWRSLLAFDAWFWRYLSCLSALGPHRAAFRSRLWTLFVVFQSTWPFYCLPSMLDFDAICGVPEHLAILLFAFEFDFDWYLSWPDILLEVIAFLRCLILMLFVVAGSTFESHCSPSMLDFIAICGVPEHLAILLFVFEAWLCCYLSWPEVLLEVIAFLRCLILTLFVVAGHSFDVHCLSSMLDFDGICRLWAHLALIELSSEVDFERYLWCSRAVGYVIVCLRCLILMLFVVAGHGLLLYAFLQKFTLNAICRGRRYFWKSLLAFNAWFWRYMRCSRALGYFIVCLRCLILMLFVVAGSTFRSHCFSSMLDSDAICRGRTYFWRSLLFFDAWFWWYLSWPEVLLKATARLRCLIFTLFVVF